MRWAEAWHGRTSVKAELVLGLAWIVLYLGRVGNINWIIVRQQSSNI